MNALTVEKKSKIQELAGRTETSNVVFTALALRDRMRHTTDLNRFKTQLVKEAGNVIERDYLLTFKELQNIGVGSIVYGRKNKPTKFKWHYDLKEVGSAAFGERSKEEQAKPAPKKIEVMSFKQNGLNVTLKKGNTEINLAFGSQEELVEFIKQAGII